MVVGVVSPPRVIPSVGSSSCVLESAGKGLLHFLTRLFAAPILTLCQLGRMWSSPGAPSSALGFG